MKNERAVNAQPRLAKNMTSSLRIADEDLLPADDPVKPTRRWNRLSIRQEEASASHPEERGRYRGKRTNAFIELSGAV